MPEVNIILNGHPHHNSNLRIEVQPWIRTVPNNGSITWNLDYQGHGEATLVEIIGSDRPLPPLTGSSDTSKTRGAFQHQGNSQEPETGTYEIVMTVDDVVVRLDPGYRVEP